LGESASGVQGFLGHVLQRTSAGGHDDAAAVLDSYTMVNSSNDPSGYRPPTDGNFSPRVATKDIAETLGEVGHVVLLSSCFRTSRHVAQDVTKQQTNRSKVHKPLRVSRHELPHRSFTKVGTNLGIRAAQEA
jgi:hypothetical protein